MTNIYQFIFIVHGRLFPNKFLSIFDRNPESRGVEMRVQFFLPIDQTADGSIRHQGYWSPRSSILLGRFQMQMHLNSNLWQHTNSLTNCSQTLYKHSDSMCNWFLSPPPSFLFHSLHSTCKLFYMWPQRPGCETNCLTVGCRLKI